MAKATKIHEESLSQLATNGIEENDLYSITDYPVGGLTQQQMLNALTVAQEGFYQINSVYMCVDTGVNYLQNHFYRFNGNSWVDVTPEFAGEIKTKTLAEMESEVIDEDTLYNIVDYPIGGITQQQMLDALEPEQLGFYQVGSVYLCTDSGNDYVQNHFYKFSYDALQDEYSWVDTHAGADIDDALSTISTNPVENRVVTNALNDKVSLTADEIIYGEKTFTETPKLGVSRLPAEFTEVEYIEGTGTQYLDTGTTLNLDSKLEMTLQMTTVSSAQNIFGSRTSASSNCFTFFSDTTQFFIDFRTNSNRFTTSFTTEKIDVLISKTFLKIGTVTRTLNVTTSFTTPSNALIFYIGNNQPAGSGVYAKMKLYSCKIYNNDTLIRDFIPCYANQTVTNNGTTYTSGTIGLYDLANNIFYVNSGTGTFIKGEDSLIGVDFATITDVNTKVGLTGNETISGIKNFISTPQVNNVDVALSNDVVNLTTNQTIAGIKTFKSRPKLGEVRLPIEFTEVEYIQTDGNQYVNTGANPSQARVLYDFEFTGGARQFIYGWYSSNNMVYFPHKDSDGQLAIRYASTAQQFGVATNNYRYNVDATIYPGNIKIILNGSQIYSSTSSFTQTTRTLWLFCSNDSSDGAYLKSQVKLYSSKIYDGDTLIRDFVPCYTNQSVTNNGITYVANTIGLYDVVNDIFYVNSGTGDFLKGNDVLVGEEFAIVSEIPTIEANNQSATTATLTKLSIDGVNYAISGGGSGSTVTFRDWSST